VAISPLVGLFFRSPEAGSVLPVAALTFLFSPFGSVSAALIQRRMQFRYSTTADWTDTLVGAVMTVTFALNGFRYWSIVYGNLIAVAVRVLVQMYLAGWRPEFRWSRRALAELFPFGFGLQTKRLLEYGSSNLDNVVVGRILGMASLGFYDKAFSTMNRLVTRLTLGQAPFRIFAIIHEDADRFRRAYGKLITSITLLAFPVLTGCIVAARPLFTVMYGERWLPAVLPFQLLCAGGMLKLLNAYAAQANEAAGNIWPQVRRQAVGAVLIVIGAAIGSSVSGVIGAAFGVLVAMLILTVLMQALVKDVTGLSWSGLLTPAIPALTCSAVLVGVLLGADALLRLATPAPPALLELAVQAGAGGLFYAAFVLFSPFATVRDIVTETLNDMLPARAQRVLTWRPKPLSRPH
jgi:O-antigen/teichoic acid export membrane protein